MSILLVIILGGIVGYVAARLMGRHEGILASIIIGIVGSFIGRYVSQLITGSDQSFLALSASGLFWSVIGAVILVAILNMVRRPRHNTI